MSAASKNKRVVMTLSGIAVAMLGLGFASKPLYEKFCAVTGYGGTTRVAELASDKVLDRSVLVRFDSNVNPELNWTFAPEVISVPVKLGQNALAFYTAKNDSDVPVVGTATYNVAPIKAAPFFSKLECFCFTEQKLEPGESVRMPVMFFIDPLLAEDPRYDDIKTITLSYTFHRVDSPGDDAFTSADRAKRIAEIQSMELTQ